MRTPLDLAAILSKSSHSFQKANAAVLNKQYNEALQSIVKADYLGVGETPILSEKEVVTRLANMIGKKALESQGTAISELPKESIAYAEQAFIDFVVAAGLPPPAPEHRFAPPRRWRMDWAWVEEKVALECQGGIFSQGRHTRGAALLKEWEKLNTAATMGWRFLFCQPSELMSSETIETIRKALEYRTNL